METPKQLAIQAGALISLYLSLTFTILLAFSLINLFFPDSVDSVWRINSYQSSLRWSTSMVIVFLPTYLTLTRITNRHRRQAGNNSYLKLTKWFIYLSLLIAGLVILGDLVSIIYTFLNGELTWRFFFKAIVLLALVGAAFTYYVLDARDYWLKKSRASVGYGIAVSILAIILLTIGFTKMESPQTLRAYNIDQRQESDLQMIQSQVSNYIYTEGEVPDSLQQAYGDYRRLPVAPTGQAAYEYQKTDTGFALCATFLAPSRENDYYYPVAINESADQRVFISESDNWQHNSGRTCFERKVSIKADTDNLIIK